MGQIGYFFNLIFTFPIFNVLILLDRVLGDFGLAIILLTVLIRLVLFPLTLKQLKSTKAMQAIQPLIADVKKQYPKDQRAQLEATQDIYKEYGINPAAGCLPLFIQLPVIYGLYNSLNTVLRNHPTVNSLNSIIYPFLPHLSRLPDANLNWFTFINPHWFISLGQADPTHILPVLAGLATFIQLRMSQPRTTAATKNAMSQQMQIMQFIMPVITLVFALTFPAGLALYWTTTSIFSMVQQYFVTGWGSLFLRPSFLPAGLGGDSSNGKSKSYTGDQRKETKIVEQAANSDKKNDNGNAGPVGRKLSTYANGTNGNSPNGASSTPARRRARPGSASARRRSNVPRRNPSRS
ncbi:MAG TPA: YidC/Oxa1 family membrane protein insertase [Ktedonobacteraceae bacterium]|nr:YidC/Oxa1 family membrane protein insertase [Ktedonobacteraceae bacterium]